MIAPTENNRAVVKIDNSCPRIAIATTAGASNGHCRINRTVPVAVMIAKKSLKAVRRRHDVPRPLLAGRLGSIVLSASRFIATH